MSKAILVINAGSSSLKFSVFRVADHGMERWLHGQMEGIPARPYFLVMDDQGNKMGEQRWQAGESLNHEQALELLLAWIESQGMHEHQFLAAGHRVVHGGMEFDGSRRVDAQVLERLEELIPLAPLHQPHHLAAIRALLRLQPQLPQVVCFDTAFHRSQPALAQAFALPRRLTAQGIRRYGFHGLSYEYIAAILPEHDARAARGRTIVAHLGNGASMCAMQAGRSVATTMSFTPLDGLPMGTRCGALDAAVVLYLINHQGMSSREVEQLLYHESGLLGVSEIAADMRTLLGSSDSRAAEAIDLFVYRIGREIGSLAAALGGLDALVFTGGIGEHAAPIRARVCRDAAWLGLELDEAANTVNQTSIHRSDSRVSIWVLATNEEMIIAQQTRRCLQLH